jgi:PKD repeat protein
MVEHGFLLTNGTIPAPPPVENQPPVAVAAAASADPVSGKAPLTVYFDASGSTGGNLGYSWDFMDGSVSTDPNPSHTFTLADRYPVTLTVTDDQNTRATSVATITVRKGRRK